MNFVTNDFELELRRRFHSCLGNNFSDNYDFERFGSPRVGLLRRIKSKLLANYTSNVFLRGSFRNLDRFLRVFGKNAAATYQLLANQQSRNLYIDLICYKILGNAKVKIIDTKDLLKERQLTKFIRGGNHKLKIDFNKKSWLLEDFKVEVNNQKLTVLSRPSALFTEFVIEQYSYRNADVCIEIDRGDYCIDAGACWGDSTLYFASKAGDKGRVFAIEFIPGNVEILKRNVTMNSAVFNNVEILNKPLWSESGVPVWYTDKGPASTISFQPFHGAEGKTSTYTIDELVNERALTKVDFIKMDIEGAESKALIGAKNSIIRFKPKLAICIYHSNEDFTLIAQWLNELGIGYNFYLKHATIYGEETVLFAI